LSILKGFILFFCAAGTLWAQTHLQELLPRGSELSQWKLQAKPEVFSGEALFNYIDGGAEIYFEYGFRQVLVQDFLDSAGDLISLEIFEMASAESAYGIYSFKRSPEGEPINLDDEAQLADYYLNLWKGNFLVTVTGSNSGEKIREGVLTIGRAVEAKIKGRAEKPDLVTLLPTTGLLEQSVKYFKGQLGLFNSYPFFTADVFVFKQAVKGDYAAGYSLFILEYPDSQSARQRFAEAEKNLRKSERYRDFSAEEGIIQAVDGKGRQIFGSASRKYLLLLVGGEDFQYAKKIFAGVGK